MSKKFDLYTSIYGMCVGGICEVPRPSVPGVDGSGKV